MQPHRSPASAADFIRQRGQQTDTARAGSEISLSGTATPKTAIAVALQQVQPQTKGGPQILDAWRSMRLARDEARMNTELRRRALEDEFRLRLKAQEGQAARVDAELDIAINEMHAALGAHVLASESELVSTIDAVRRQVQLSNFRQRFAVIEQFLAEHVAGVLSEAEFDHHRDRIFEDYDARDAQLAAAAKRCIDEVADLLRKHRRA